MNEPTDTELLDFLTNQGDMGVGWVARTSRTGRGYRLHQTEAKGFPTPREAIKDAMLKARYEPAWSERTIAPEDGVPERILVEGVSQWHGTYLNEDEIVASMVDKIRADPDPEVLVMWHDPKNFIEAYGWVMAASVTIRNYYGLWHEANPYTETRKDRLAIENGTITDPRFPDNMSARIIERVRAELAKEAGKNEPITHAPPVLWKQCQCFVCHQINQFTPSFPFWSVEGDKDLWCDSCKKGVSHEASIWTKWVDFRPPSSPAKGFIEVGITPDGSQVVLNHPDLRPDENGCGHIVFSPQQAEHLAQSLFRKAAEACGGRLRISGRVLAAKLPDAERWYYENRAGRLIRFLPDPAPPSIHAVLSRHESLRVIEMEVWIGPDTFNWRMVTPNVEVYW